MVSMLQARLNPVQLGPSGKRDVRTQFGALTYRVEKGKLRILLISSRETKRWIIPKGWPAHGQTATESASGEAFEEAGAIGQVHDVCLGIYSYRKKIDKAESLPIIVAVFPMKVKKLVEDYPEAKERTRRWCSPKKAASLVHEPELQHMIRRFDPRQLTR